MYFGGAPVLCSNAVAYPTRQMMPAIIQTKPPQLRVVDVVMCAWQYVHVVFAGLGPRRLLITTAPGCDTTTVVAECCPTATIYSNNTYSDWQRL